MKICYLNHDIRSNTGAGRFYNSFTAAVKKAIPGIDIEILTSENILYPNKFKLLLALPVIRKILKRCDIIHALDGWPYGVIAAIASIGLRKSKRDIRTPDVLEVQLPKIKSDSSILRDRTSSANDRQSLGSPISGTSDVPRFIITAIGTGAIQPLYSWWKRPIMKWAYRKADRVIAVSNNTKKEILKVIPDLKIEVINHGVDAKKFDVGNNRDDRNENNSINPPAGRDRSSNFDHLKPYILSIGALKKRKGYNYSIQAFAEVAKKFPDLKYVTVGDGPEKENLQSLITNNKLQNRVVFLNNLPEKELIALYRNAELFILLPQDINKDIEGFGLAFLEAAAAGLPVIAAKESSAEDAVLDGQNGILVPPRDWKAAAEAIEKVLGDSNLRKSFSEQSLKFAQLMSWDKVVDQYKNIYE